VRVLLDVGVLVAFCADVVGAAAAVGLGLDVGTSVAVGGDAVGVSVGRGVSVGTSVGAEPSVRDAESGWNGVGVAVPFGSTVTRVSGPAAFPAPDGPQEASSKAPTKSAATLERIIEETDEPWPAPIHDRHDMRSAVTGRGQTSS